MMRTIAALTLGLAVGLSLLGGAAEVTTSGTGYPAGQCTAYVASQLPWIPSNWGNADEWLLDAARAGFTTRGGADLGGIGPGDVAVIGANTKTGNGTASGDGHVGIVTAIDRGARMVTISSENWPEGDDSPRLLSFAAGEIEGYILPPAGASMPAWLVSTPPATSLTGSTPSGAPAP
jgi:surface antigen